MTHKYYKYYDDSDLFSGWRYVEALDSIAIREITVNGESMIASNIKYPRWGVLLAEGDCDFDDIEEVQAISGSEFVRLWQRHLQNNAGRWHMTKLAYEIGAPVTGVIEQFRSQGALIDIGDGVLGVADYDECKASTEERFLMLSGQLVSARVRQYDEEYQWLVLETPQVSAQRREFAW